MHSPQDYEELVLSFLRNSDPLGAIRLLADDSCPLSSKVKHRLQENARNQLEVQKTAGQFE